MKKNYYYIIMSQIDFLENQVIEEIIREKATFYKIQNKKRDFWILIQPTFLQTFNLEKTIQKSRFYQQNEKRIKNSNEDFYATIISTEKKFLDWIELRTGSFEDMKTINEEQKTGTSNGLKGEFSSLEDFSPLSFQKERIHPKRKMEKYQKGFSFLSQK